MDEELLEIIDNAFRNGLTQLDLSENQLTQLPPEIGQLTNLTVLDLSGNQLTQLPSEISRLTKLTNFYLENNKFKVSEEVLEKEDPREIIKEILFVDYGELVVSIATQRNLRKNELTKLTEWLSLFKIRAGVFGLFCGVTWFFLIILTNSMPFKVTEAE